MERERKEREKTKLLWAFVPASIAAVWALGYTLHIWPSLVRERPHPVYADTATRHYDSLPDSTVKYLPTRP